ncbi:MAG: hypothetical protein ACJ8MH_05845 [Povalibacter sp.]
MQKAFTCVLMLMSMAAFGAEPAPAIDQPKSQALKPTSETAKAEPAVNTQKQTAAPARRTNDRLELDTTVVTGNRELPKVLYIVPWKKADIGDLPAQPFNTLLDEALTPVDRDVFRREVTYYGAMSSGGDKDNPASAAPAAGPEK